MPTRPFRRLARLVPLALTLLLVLLSDQAALDLKVVSDLHSTQQRSRTHPQAYFSCPHASPLVFIFIGHHVHVSDRTIHHHE
ncbi:hypothetical protein BV25DRAFT_1817932 [Artomyces pyxidatus]|uniref:Uncharacterized protein n=1 Tax=Artomyces pyxidatus TaxID=48021 RepID=A0ACB8TKM6_9AGAM|nr:hypothetical protein BV25DRAFT_1817932 [Artomyces pyxidatus]